VGCGLPRGSGHTRISLLLFLGIPGGSGNCIGIDIGLLGYWAIGLLVLVEGIMVTRRYPSKLSHGQLLYSTTLVP